MRQVMPGPEPLTWAAAHVDAGLTERIVQRIAETGAELVTLPESRVEETDKGLYPQDMIFLVKRLRAQGIQAEYLDPSENRVFGATWTRFQPSPGGWTRPQPMQQFEKRFFKPIHDRR